MERKDHSEAQSDMLHQSKSEYSSGVMDLHGPDRTTNHEFVAVHMKILLDTAVFIHLKQILKILPVLLLQYSLRKQGEHPLKIIFDFSKTTIFHS